MVLSVPSNDLTIPRWQLIASTYNEAVQIILTRLSEAYGGQFYNCRRDEIGPEDLRESKRKKDYIAKLAEVQKSRMLTILGQFCLAGRRHSFRRALEVKRGNDFSFGVFETGVMLLAHPELRDFNNLWIDCAGDESNPNDEYGFSLAPFFILDSGWVRLDSFWVGLA